MPPITEQTTLRRVQHILASGSGRLDFAVDRGESYLTWQGREDADWRVADVARVENFAEDRLVIYPEGGLFTCEIAARGEAHNPGPVRCYVP